MRFADLNPVARLTAAAIHLGLSFLISLALIRDEGLLESALARPENLAAYGEPDEAALAAA